MAAAGEEERVLVVGRGPEVGLVLGLGVLTLTAGHTTVEVHMDPVRVAVEGVARVAVEVRAVDPEVAPDPGAGRMMDLTVEVTPVGKEVEVEEVVGHQTQPPALAPVPVTAPVPVPVPVPPITTTPSPPKVLRRSNRRWPWDFKRTP